MWDILKNTKQFITCLKVHKTSKDSGQVRDWLQKYLQILNTAQQQLDEKMEFAKAIELVEQALLEVDVGVFWLNTENHTVELPKFSFPEDSPFREFFEACLKAA